MALPNCHHHQDFPSFSFLILLGTPTPGKWEPTEISWGSTGSGRYHVER